MCEEKKDGVDDWQHRDYQGLFTCEITPDSIDKARFKVGQD